MKKLILLSLLVAMSSCSYQPEVKEDEKLLAIDKNKVCPPGNRKCIKKNGSGNS